MPLNSATVRLLLAAIDILLAAYPVIVSRFEHRALRAKTCTPAVGRALDWHLTHDLV